VYLEEMFSLIGLYYDDDNTTLKCCEGQVAEKIAEMQKYVAEMQKSIHERLTL
jgi:hypothetical protein